MVIYLYKNTYFVAMTLKSGIKKPPISLNPEEKPRIILGVDPGTNIMGYAIIACANKETRLLVMDVVKNLKEKDPVEKLKVIFKRTENLIVSHNVTELAIEDPFYGKNVQSMLKLGRAQGMAIAAALHHDLPVHQYAARKIKQSITGNGNSSKEQVAAMLMRLLGIKESPEYLDATDALAVAMCHYNQRGPVAGGEKLNSWTAFITKNPGRVKGK